MAIQFTNNEIKKLYFYFQDVEQDLENIENFFRIPYLENKSHVSRIYFILFQKVVIDIYKLNDLRRDIKGSSSIKLKLPKFYKSYNVFINKYFGNGKNSYIYQFRNYYIAHPLKKKRKSPDEFTSVNELESLVKKILNMDANENVRHSTTLEKMNNYISNIHKDFYELMRNLSYELKQNNISFERL